METKVEEVTAMVVDTVIITVEDIKVMVIATEEIVTEDKVTMVAEVVMEVDFLMEEIMDFKEEITLKCLKNNLKVTIPTKI